MSPVMRFRMRIFVDGSVETRTDEEGRFTLSDVAAGTRRVEVRFIGMVPAHATVDVAAGDTAVVEIQVSRVPTLPGMRVKASTLGRVIAAEFESRRRLGLGYLVDSTVISRYPTFVNVLRDVPSLSVEQRGASLTASVPDGRGGTCTPTVWLDGVLASYGNLLDLTTSEVVGLEVYTRAFAVPSGFVEKGVDRKCGAIIAWTRYLFRNR